MSTTSEYNSDDESSPGSSEYHSGQEPELDRKQIIFINCNEEFTFLNIQFPMPQTYPHPYIQLSELMTTVELAPELYDRITDIPRDPNRALGYILHHFNIDRVSRSIWAYRPYHLDQVYYSTYVEPSQYRSLLNYYNLTHKQLQDALDQERLENTVDISQLTIYHSSSWIAFYSFSWNCYDPSRYEHTCQKMPHPSHCR